MGYVNGSGGLSLSIVVLCTGVVRGWITDGQVNVKGASHARLAFRIIDDQDVLHDIPSWRINHGFISINNRAGLSLLESCFESF